MALDTPGLISELTSLATTPGATVAACAAQWAQAMETYATAILPASTTVSAARAALESSLAAAFATPAAAPGMEAAFTAFATAVGTGMAPGFAATPPPGAVGFAAQFLLFPVTASAAATAVGGLIDTWMKTGTATPSGGGPPVNWS